MSNSVTFKNADHIIEQFGGIRPLASKLGVPVTTVQGWKKRNSIPETRWQEIKKLAKDLNLDLTDSNDNRPSATVSAIPSATVTPLAAPSATPRAESSAPVREKVVYKGGYSMAQGVLVTCVSVGLSIAVLAVLFGPDFVVSNPGQRLAVLEEKANTPAGTPAANGDWSAVTTLQQGQQALQDTINNTVMPRLNELQASVGTLGDPTQLAELAANIKAMQQSQQGQATLDAAVTELKTIVGGLQGRVEDLDVALVAAQKENGALAETIGKVSTTDLTAAAMLLALNQFRTSIDRQEPLADDVALLKSVINPDNNPDLAASIDRLTPFAASGVMSASGLQTELSGLAGAIVQARLNGDSASWQDIAKARLQEIFDVRNNGVPVLGTQEQKAVATAQQQLASGDIAAAKATLESLPEPSRQAAAPFIQKADQALVARQVEADVTRHFASSLQTLRSDTPSTGAPAAAPTSAPVAEPETPPTTGIAPVTPEAGAVPDILETAPTTGAETAPTAGTETAPPAAPAQPEGAQPAPSAPSL